MPPTAFEDVICVTKAYSSTVGSNTEPFVSEVLGEAGDELRRRGGDKGEFGATTGRPRRVGWFDAVATKYGCMVQGATQVALTCLDVLGYLDEIKVCTGYEIDGEVTDKFPVTRQAGAGPSLSLPPCRAGSATSGASPTMPTCRRTPRPMWTFWSSISAAPSASSLPAPSAMRFACADNQMKKGSGASGSGAFYF